MRSKPLLIGIGIAALLFIGVALYAVSRVEPADYFHLAAAVVKEQTGRELRIQGEIGYSVSLVPTVTAEDVRFQNAAWGSRPDMLSAKRIEVEIALLPLLRGKVDIRGLRLIEPDLLIEKNAQGTGNWTFAPPASEPGAASDAPRQPALDIRHAEIERGIVTYRDTEAASPRQLTIAALTLKSSSDGLHVDAHAQLNGVALALVARMEQATNARTVDVTLSTAGLGLAAKGSIPQQGAAGSGLNGEFKLQVSDWTSVAKLAAIDPIQLPALTANGLLRSENNAWVIDNLKAQLGKSNASGRLRVATTGAGRKIDAALESSFVDLAELQGAAEKKRNPDNRIFSVDPFPLAAIKALSGKLDARIARIALREGKIVEGLELKVAAEQGRVTADPAHLLVEGKALRFRAKLDASSGQHLAAEVAIDGNGIGLGALGALMNLSGTPEGSPTDIVIRFNGQGDSMRALMASANADVRIVVGPGRLRNRVIDWGSDVTELLNALNPARRSDPYTELKCAVVRLPIRQGVARVDNSIAAETAKVSVIAAGVIDFRNETLDLGFRPKAATGLGVGLGSLASLGRLRGSLTHPTVELDMGGAAKAATQLGLAAATGGLSLLAAGLLSNSVPDHACQAALTGVASSRASKPQAEPSIVEGVIGNVKRLFGR